MCKYLLSPFSREFVFLVLASFFLLSSNVFASTIKLSSGKIIDGKIVERNDELIRIDTGIGFAVTYYLDDIDSIDGYPVVSVEEKSVEQTKPALLDQDDSVEILEPISIMESVKTKKVDEMVIPAIDEEAIKKIKPAVLLSEPAMKKVTPPPVKDTTQLLEPISITESVKIKENDETNVLAEAYAFIEKSKLPSTIKPKSKMGRIQDIALIEGQNLSKGLPSPFGPTIREAASGSREVTAVDRKQKRQKVIIKIEQNQTNEQLKASDMPPTFQKTFARNFGVIIDRLLKSQAENFQKLKFDVHKKALRIQGEFEQIPLKIRRDIFIVGSLFTFFLYVLVCFPMTLIAKKLNRRHIWLTWIPMIHLVYLVYVAQKSAWWNLFYFVPIVNVLLPIAVFFDIIKLLKKPSWVIIFIIIPGINILALWYLALAKVREEPSVVRINFD